MLNLKNRSWIFMDYTIKKKIVNLSSDILAVIAVFIALMCFFFKIQNGRLTNDNMENINLLAAKCIMPRKNFHFPSITNGNIYGFEKNNISIPLGNNNNISPTPNDNKPDLTSNMELPKINGDLQDDDEDHHLPNEKTYKIIETHMGVGGTKCENFYVKNTTGQNVDFLDLLKEPLDIHIKNTNEPQVLIFHTHTSESYMKKDSGFFYESFYPRSLNNSKNVVRVGDAITEKLKEHGINAIHDKTYHDTPSYNGSYLRAEKTIKENLQKYPSLQVIIDIHRDSLGSKETGKMKPTFEYKGKKAAQLMIISGCDPDNSNGFPNWKKNLKLALNIQKYCESMFPGLTRPLNFSKVKYNEHLTPGSLLIEIGSDGNTLEEAIYTGSMLGEAISELLNNLKK